MAMTDALYGGVNAAVLTPMHDDLAPDLDRLAARCAFLLDHGCNGLAILGTTGEANSLGIAERIEIMEGLVARGIAPERLLPGTGTTAITDTVLLTRKAAELGCPGVLVLPPFFYKSPSDDGLFAYFSEVINRVGNGPAIYLYNFPQQSAVPFSLDLVARLLRAFPGRVRGMKDSSGNYEVTGAMARNFAPEGFEVYCGDDGALARLLGDGGAGCITALSNMTSAIAARVFASGDEAAQSALAALRRAVASTPLIPALRALVARQTGDAAWLNMRPPHLRLSEAAAAGLCAAFDAASGSFLR
jgi:4-hydroxy-tetrahydrodipicolinate synthase